MSEKEREKAMEEVKEVKEVVKEGEKEVKTPKQIVDEINKREREREREREKEREGENIIDLKPEVKGAVKKDKLAIIGFAPSSLYEVNKLDDTWEVWMLNEMYVLEKTPEPMNGKLLDINKATRWFEIHDTFIDPETDKSMYVDLDKRTPEGAKHCEILRNMDIPVYVQDPTYWEGGKNIVQFPAFDIIKYFGTDYITNTPSWLIAFAIYEALKETGGNLQTFKWKTIALFGVDMQVGWQSMNGKDVITSEYAVQRPSCEFWLGYIKMLEKLGMTRLIIHPKSSLMKKYTMYGYERHNKQAFGVRTDMEERHKFLTQRKAQLLEGLQKLQGQAQGELNRIQRSIDHIDGNKSEIELMLSNF